MKKYSLILSVFVGLSCGKSDTKKETAADADKPQYGGTFIYAKSGPPLTMDPALIKETESSAVCGNIFDGLVAQRAGKTAIDPALAKSWEISKDGLTYTFHLRTDVKFHDGTIFNADAVLFSLDRQRDNMNHPFHFPEDDYSPWKSFGLNELLSEIKAVDDSTVVFRLTKSDATFLSILSHHICGMISPTAMKNFKRDFSKNPVGTGPFKFSSWEANGSVVLTANEQYWDGRPYIDTLILCAIGDARKRWQELKEGRVDMISTPDKSDMNEIDHTPGIKYAKQPGLNVSYVAFNLKKKPFDNLKVRQAIVAAIDRDKLVQEVFGAFGRSAKNPIPPMLTGYNDEIRPTPYDPAAAKKLLAEAGYANGFKTKLWTMPISREYMPDPLKTAQLIQGYLKEVGIDAEIVTFQPTQWRDYLNQTYEGQHEMAVMGWVADIPDPDNFFFSLLDKTVAAKTPSSNVAFYVSEDMHKAILLGKDTPDPVARSGVYKEACAIFNKDLPWFTIAHSVTIVPMKEKVMDFQLHSTSIRRFNKLWLKHNT